MIAYVREVCPSCGNLRSVCSDPATDWYPQRSTCYATAAREVTLRRLQKKHAKQPLHESMDLHPLDGLHVWVATEDLTPDDDFV